MRSTIEQFRSALRQTTEEAARWFESHAKVRTRAEWEARGQLGDPGQGAVYAFFDANDQAIYVGETGRGIKNRQHYQTSPHKLQPWWPTWQKVRFLAMRDRTDRLALELLLVLALKPVANRKPGVRTIDAMFET